MCVFVSKATINQASRKWKVINMNKYSLSKAMQQYMIVEKDKTAILEIIEQCETGIFTNSETAGDKKKLLMETKEALEKMNNQIGKQIVNP